MRTTVRSGQSAGRDRMTDPDRPSTRTSARRPLTLAVNPIACDGHGLCAELLPELITLDDWGFPIIDVPNVPASLEAHARTAVNLCPVLALRLAAS